MSVVISLILNTHVPLCHVLLELFTFKPLEKDWLCHRTTFPFFGYHLTEELNP
jgi:hypothetical protein